MISKFTLPTLFLSLTLAWAEPSYLAIRQNSTMGNATIEVMTTYYDSLVYESSLSFPYQAPHIQATATNEQTYYVVSYPLDDPNGSAHMWELSATQLFVWNEWVQPAGGLMFFDIQYSYLQKKLFGIAVNGTYGRVISKLDISGSYVTADYIVACPYMWYVNASSFDHTNDVYYALLNNFNLDVNNMSVGQKLMTVNVEENKGGSSEVYDYANLDSPDLYFIQYTPFGIYAIGGNQDTGLAQLCKIELNDAQKMFSCDVVDDPNSVWSHGIGSQSPIFYYGDPANDGRESVCSALGNDEAPVGLGCYRFSDQYTSFTASHITDRDGARGNIHAVACDEDAPY